MKIAITGGAGFIGRATARTLLSDGHELLIVDSLQRRVHPDGLPEEVENWQRLDLPVVFEKRDVRQRETWHAIFAWEPDAILHLAAYQDYQPDYATFFETNVTSTAIMYEQAAARDWVGQIVVAGSQASLGEGLQWCDYCAAEMIGVRRSADRLAAGDWESRCDVCEQPLRPKWTPEERTFPVTPYGVSKLAEEEVALKIGAMIGVESVSLRYSIVQGMGQSPFNVYSGVLRAMSMQLLAKRPELILFEDGEQQRDFVGIADVVDANVMALYGELEPGPYNVSGGQAFTLRELAETMIDISGVDTEIVTPGLYRVGDVRHTLSSSYALRDQGWQPTTNLKALWAQYWRWLAKQGIDGGAIIDGAWATMRDRGVLKQASAS